MEGLRTLFDTFFADTSGQAALAVLLVGIIDFVLGVAAAWRDKTFTWAALDAWLRSNLAGKIFPTWILLVIGFLAAGIQFAGLSVITMTGYGAAVLYVTATLAGIAAKWGPSRERQGVPTD